MVSIETARQQALSLPGSEENLHFQLPGIRVNKKLFATIHRDKGLMMVKLSSIDQIAFCSFNKDLFFLCRGMGRDGLYGYRSSKSEKKIAGGGSYCRLEKSSTAQTGCKIFR